jgi:hypothetical protein
MMYAFPPLIVEVNAYNASGMSIRRDSYLSTYMMLFAANFDCAKIHESTSFVWRNDLKLNKSTVTWLVIIGLIIFSGVVSALWPSMREGLLGGSGGGSGIALSGPNIDPSDKTITFGSGIPILGDRTINEYMALLIIAVPVFLIVPAVGVGLWLAFSFLSNTVEATLEDPEFKSNVAALEKRESDVIKEYKQISPPDPVPNHDRTRWIWISSILTVGLLFTYIGAAWSDSFAGGNNQSTISAGFALIGLLLGYLLIWPRRKPVTIAGNQGEESAIPWETIFLVVTGILVVGLGMAVMFWVRSQTG